MILGAISTPSPALQVATLLARAYLRHLRTTMTPTAARGPTQAATDATVAGSCRRKDGPRLDVSHHQSDGCDSLVNSGRKP